MATRTVTTSGGLGAVGSKHSPAASIQRGAIAPAALSAERLRRIRRWSRIMDSQFRIPGTPVRFGFDSLIGLVPGIGDVVTTLIPAMVILEAHRAGVSRLTLSRMIANVAIDSTVGLIPVVGDVFDFYWKANLKNLKLLEKEASKFDRASDRRVGG
jgi:hypothetical protein